MQKLASKELINGGPRVLFIILWEPPTFFTFRVCMCDGNVDDICKTFDVANEIGAMGERTEEAFQDSSDLSSSHRHQV